MRIQRKVISFTLIFITYSLIFTGMLAAEELRFNLPSSFGVDAQGILLLTVQPNWTAKEESTSSDSSRSLISIAHSNGDRVLLIPTTESELKIWSEGRDKNITLDAAGQPLLKENLSGDFIQGSFCMMPINPSQPHMRILGDLKAGQLFLSFNCTFISTNNWPEAKRILESIRVKHLDDIQP